jgi:dTDP-4-amino-4,6-dideoxygalactose transaminase
VVSHNQSIFIIEDASQCFTGSSVSPSHCVDMTILSFQAFKLVTAGEGGALLTDNLELYTKALQFHDAGLQRFSSHLSIVDAHEIPTGIGLNLRMNEVSAGILHCQLKKYQKITSDLKISRTNLLKSLSPAFEAGIMRFISTERINYAYLTLQGNSKDIIENFVEKLQQLGYPFKIAGKLPYHALPGWLRYLEYNHYHYHAINIEQTNAILDTTIIIEVNWQLDDKSINQFSDTISGLVSHFI